MSNESENKPARRVDDKRAEVPLNWSENTQAPVTVPAAPIPVDVMIDIETLGTTPGSAILSIGAVVFGPEGLGDTFYAPILLQSCAAVGLTIDPNTIAWWMQQSDEARAAAFRTDADPIADVLEQFTCWYGLVGAERPWCHGATFDVPLLDAAYKACGMKAPWRFYDVRDTRTLYDLAGVKVNRSTGTHHNALDDATAQAEAAARAMHILDVHAAISSPPPSAAEKPTSDLTDEQIIKMHDAVFGWLDDGYKFVLRFARDIERAAIAAHLAGQSQATKVQAVPVPRATLLMIYEAMNYMGDILNNMDACDEEGEEATTPAFDALRELLDDSFVPKSTAQEVTQQADAPEARTENEGIWPWERRAAAAEAFMRNYADTHMEELLGGYHVQPIIRRLAAAIKEWQADAVKEAPDGVVGIEIPAPATQQAAKAETAEQAKTGIYEAALLAVERMRGCAATYIENHAKDNYPGEIGLRPQDVASMWAQEIHRIDAKAYLDEAIADLAPTTSTVSAPGSADDIRNQALEDAAMACEGEQVEDTGTDGDTGYNNTVAHCAAAIRALQTGSANTLNGGDHA